MKLSISVALLGAILLATGKIPAAEVLLGPVTNPSNGHQYYLLTQDTWTESEKAAEALGGTLAIINDAAENQWVFETFGAIDLEIRTLWIGLSDIFGTGEFTWVTEEPVEYTNWGPDRPGPEGNFVYIVRPGAAEGRGGTWNNDFNVSETSDGNPIHGVAEIVVPPIFLEVTDTPFAEDQGNSRGGFWADYDSDGDLDLFVTNAGVERDFLYNNDGGVFTRAPENAITSAETTSTDASWGDIDNDGDLDLFVAVHGGDMIDNLFINQGDGNFQPISGEHPNIVTGHSIGCSWADYDSDGLIDLFVAQSQGENNLLYRNTGNAQFAKVTDGAIVSDGGRSICPVWADYDNDGDMDLFVGNADTDFLYRNEGDGNFTRLSQGPHLDTDERSESAAWGDFDNDGNLDLLVSTVTTVQASEDTPRSQIIFRNNGAGQFAEVQDAALAINAGDTPSCSWVDFDNDGWLDIAIANHDDGIALLFRNIEGEEFERVRIPMLEQTEKHTRGLAWADYDNDGDLDFYAANWQGVANMLFANAGNDNNWIRLRCVGTLSNRSGIGARITVTTASDGQTIRQIREINDGGRYYQNDLEAHFGLGGAEIIESIEIRWPSGIRQMFHDVTPNMVYEVTEPPLLTIRRAGDAGYEILIRSRGGFDYRLEGTDDLNAWDDIKVVERVNGTVQVLDGSLDEIPYRFFRAVQVN